MRASPSAPRCGFALRLRAAASRCGFALPLLRAPAGAPERQAAGRAGARSRSGRSPGACTLLFALAAAGAAEIELRAPLATTVEAAQRVAGARQVTVALTVPDDAPADLGLGVFARDRDGRWWQKTLVERLAPGEHRFSVVIDPEDGLEPLAHRAGFDAAALAEGGGSGVCLWSASASRARVQVDCRVEPAAVPLRAGTRLDRLELPGFDPAAGVVRLRTGERWEASFLPVPLPANPYDPELLACDLLITAPDGASLPVAAFWNEPQRLIDAGDREQAEPDGTGRFQVRWRPLRPGRHRAELTVRWRGGAELRWTLPPLAVEGAAVDPFVRIDRDDRRFVAVDGRFFWPVGLNLHSPFDKRSHDSHGTVLTPSRHSLVYRDMFARLAAAGGDACEIWMAAWNLALEWRTDWPGYRGLGRYSQGNAARLDAVLDYAWAQGIRVNLVINNHGQASANADREWRINPWNEDNGGPLDDPADVFADPEAAAGQERLRRYLAARVADHPAVLGWKMWSEINLTAARGPAAVAWHARAAARWKAVDPYDHPVTTHWSGDYKVVDVRIAAVPGIDYVCIDAYRQPDRGGFLAELLAASTVDPARGLSRLGKPVLATEHGATSGASAEGARDADHRTAAFAALVSGHLGAAMIWWWEWVDQGGRWAPFGAIRRFIAGEDLRGADARSAPLAVDAPLWARAWVRPGRLLGYVVDPRWAGTGATAARIAGAQLTVGDPVAPGRLHVQWWDAETGTVVGERDLDHPGGTLRLELPPFAAHCAFKLWRVR
jgi:hypothetical protein